MDDVVDELIETQYKIAAVQEEFDHYNSLFNRKMTSFGIALPSKEQYAVRGELNNLGILIAETNYEGNISYNEGEYKLEIDLDKVPENKESIYSSGPKAVLEEIKKDNDFMSNIDEICIMTQNSTASLVVAYKNIDVNVHQREEQFAPLCDNIEPEYYKISFRFKK